MKRALRAVLWVVVVALSVGPWAVAQTSVTLTAPPPGFGYDNIYMSPYYATVGGSTNTAIICDDFGDTSTKSTWTATVTPFTGLSAPAGTSWTMAGGTWAQYDAVAYLTLQVLNQAYGSAGQVEYSFADWAIFDPTGVAKYLTSNPVTSGSLTTAALCNDIFGSGAFNATTKVCTAAIGGLVGTAYAALVPSGGYHMEIISPDVTGSNPLAVCRAETHCAAQEFIAVSAPEGGAAIGYLFLAGLCCFGAMFLRRRQARTISAA
jgi:hypothetical protein